MTDKHSTNQIPNQSTNQRTDMRAHREVILSIIWHMFFYLDTDGVRQLESLSTDTLPWAKSPDLGGDEQVVVVVVEAAVVDGGFKKEILIFVVKVKVIVNDYIFIKIIII